MMRYITHISSLYLIAALLCWGCSKDQGISATDQDEIDQQVFTAAASAVGIYNIGIPVESLDDATSQLYQSRSGALARIISDEGALLSTFEFGAAPSSRSEGISLKYTPAGGSSTSYTLSAVKSSGGKLWLWSSDAKVGVVMLGW